MWLLLILIFTCLLIAYRLLAINYGYWKKRGVPNPSVNIIFGNIWDSITLKKNLGQVYADVYNQYTNLRYVGFYKVRTPALLIRDLGIVEDVLIKDFSSFHDNDFEVDEKLDPIMAKNPFTLKGNHWKVVRNQIIACFTSKKLKLMFPLIEEVGEKLIKYLVENSKMHEKDGIEAKELGAKFTTESVATCAFGLDAQSFANPNAEFLQVGKKMLTPSPTMAIKHLVALTIPSLANFLSVKFFPDDVTNYFRNTVTYMLNYRKNNKIVRNDFLDIMNELKTKSEYEFNDEDIVAHAAGFYTDGFETSSIALSFTLYELAANPSTQIKLREEINKIIAKNGGKLTYDGLHEMAYLDNILNESLRMHPPAMFMTRKCTKQFTLPPPYIDGKGSSITVEVGTPIIIPLYAIHYDSKYFPNPDKFDPDRFNEENKMTIPKCSFLSFGEGPRICLGQRFGVTQTKLALVTIIKNFEVRVNPRTPQPPEVNPQYFLLRAKAGLWINFYKINSN